MTTFIVRLRRVRMRQTGQGLVDFGLILVLSAVVGVVGLTVLGRAEEGYFIPIKQEFGKAAPTGSDDVVHPTSVPFSCTPDPVLVGQQMTCTFGVDDAWGSKRTPPAGNVHLLMLVPGPPPVWADKGSCPLVADASGGDLGYSKCTVPIYWTPDVSNWPSVTLAAHYVTSDITHAAPATDPVQVATVKVNVAFGPSPLGCQSSVFP